MANIISKTNLVVKNDFWNGKRVLITGGSKGLGKAITLFLEKLGAKIAIVSRSEQDLKAVSEPSENISFIQADISNKEDIYKISGQAMSALGGIDVLINNASSLGPLPMKHLIDTECEELTETFETNFFGPFRLTKAVLSSMLLQNKGIVINISSDAVLGAYPTWGSYSTSKIALDHLTRIWGEELSSTGVKFIGLDPGDMHTDMHLDAIPDADISTLYKPENVAEDFAKFIGTDKLVNGRYSASEWRSFL